MEKSLPTYRVPLGWLLLLAAAILPFLLLAFYNYPSIHDDYGDANQVNALGPVGYMRNLYGHWTGRYTEFLLKAYLNPLSYRRTAELAHAQPMLIIGLLVTGFYALFRALLRGVAQSLPVACALLATVLYLNAFSNVGAAIYWFGGYTSYTAGGIASCFAFAGMVSLHRARSRSGQLGSWALAAGFGALAVGAYEVSMMAVLWVAGSAAVAAWATRHRAKAWFTVLLLVVAAGAYAAMSASGNQERALTAHRNLSQLVRSPQLVVIGVKSCYFALTQSTSWANSMLLLVGSLLLIELLLRVPGALLVGAGRPHPGALAGWVLGGLSCVVFPSVLAYQTVWAHSWQCVYFYFLLGWLWLLLLVAMRAGPRLIAAVIRHRGLLAAGFCGLCFLNGTSNTHLAYLDLATSAPEYYRRVRQREQTVVTFAARQQRKAELRPLYAYEDNWMLPKVLYTFDFSPGDGQQYILYYGLDSVLIKPLPYHP